MDTTEENLAEQILKEQINKIASSSTFSGKDTSTRLLNYLLETNINKEEIKEVNIAEVVFGRGNGFNPLEDAIVRVNIHKTKQLLEQYYLSEGKADLYKITISKGKYKLLISKQSLPLPGESKGPLRINKKYVVLSLLLISVIVNMVVIGYLLLKNKSTSSVIWRDYITNGKPTAILLGNPFFLKVDFNDSTNIIVRDLSINSPSDNLSKLNHTFVNKVKSVQPLPYPYFSKNNVWPLVEILAEFDKNKTQVQLESLSDFNPDELKQKNIVIIGNVNSFRLFNLFLEKSSIRITEDPRSIRLSDGRVFQTTDNAAAAYTDYAFMIKIPGENRTVISMIGDFHSSGNKRLAELVTSPDIERMFQKFGIEKGSFPQYFEMIIKVQGYNYSGLKSDIVYFKKLSF